MKKYISSVIFILILIAFFTHNFWTNSVKQFWNTKILHEKQIAREIRLDMTNNTFTFNGSSYYLYRIEKITGGWAVYYSPSPDQDPNNSESAVILNYYVGTVEGQQLTVEAWANLIKAKNTVEGATLLQTFETPDPRNDKQSIFYIPMYFVYPENQSGDVYITKIMQNWDGASVVSVIFKQSVIGQTKTEIEAAANQWLVDNIQTYGKELADISSSELTYWEFQLNTSTDNSITQ